MKMYGLRHNNIRIEDQQLNLKISKIKPSVSLDNIIGITRNLKKNGKIFMPTILASYCCLYIN